MQAVLFDLDGTLTDSEPIITWAFDQTMRERQGLVQDLATYVRYIGPPLHESFRHLGVPEAEVESYITTYRKFYNSRAGETQLFPGIREMLVATKELGLGAAVATSKKQSGAEYVCRATGMTEYFDAICGASETDKTRQQKWHSVECALASLTEQGILDVGNARPERPREGAMDRPADGYRSDVLMVGDRRFDVEGAGIFSIATVLVEWGAAPEEERELAWRNISSPAELVDLLEELTSGGSVLG